MLLWETTDTLNAMESPVTPNKLHYCIINNAINSARSTCNGDNVIQSNDLILCFCSFCGRCSRKSCGIQRVEEVDLETCNLEYGLIKVSTVTLEASVEKFEVSFNW